MRDLKYLFTGLAVSAVIFCILLAAFVFVSPETFAPVVPLPAFLDTETPTITPFGFISVSTDASISIPAPALATTDTTNASALSTPTWTPDLSTPTETFTPTLSPTPTLNPGQVMLDSGGLVITGPLSPEAQIQLYETSLTFIALTTREARAKGEAINGKGYGSPTLICGPLSIAILRDSGLVPPETVPYNFWIINPDNQVDRNKLERLFPNDRYENIRYRTRLLNFDWRSDPLQPGDFLYLFAGTGGTFEHMLVVNRVDNLGRAYSVTNYNTGNGFIIDEMLLYDPNDPQAGLFYQWNSRPRAPLGATGFAGFERWRLIPTQPQ